MKLILAHFILPEKIDLGLECNRFLQSNIADSSTELTIRKNCLEFYVTAASEMQERFPLHDSFFDSLTFLEPKIALSAHRPEHLSTLQKVWTKFSWLDAEAIEIEWKKLLFHFSPDEKEVLGNKNIPEFWDFLENVTNFENNYIFSNISKLASLCMSLPHSNAETERVFSVVTDVRTKKRNRIGSDALNAVSLIRYSDKSCCQNFVITDEHIKLMKSNNLYS